ncbi:hypothetical protein EDB19DRAFT_1920468 [Suillus lakei]|nr:hypothetical protein EDB19DRAFT_1920468 [Suillus lakei]
MATAPSAQRSRSNPSPCDVRPLHHDVPALRNSDSNHLHFRFQSLVSCPADAPLELFETAVSQLIHHPEYNSTLILRSETISDSDTTIPSSVPRLEGYCPVRNVHRKLLPRRPGRDSGLEQHCTLYALETGDFAGLPSMLVLTPLVSEGESLPYYHPTVSHLVFRFIPSNSTTTPDSASTQPALRIGVVQHPGTPTDPNSRLYTPIVTFGVHSLIIRSAYSMMSPYPEKYIKTYISKCDIGIATFLMLFWKDMFATSADRAAVKELDDSQWTSWPRPSGGFLDLGCGNGLLTHILSVSAEGYSGYGIDLCARISWAHYPDSSQTALKVHALDPTQLLSPSSSNDEEISLWEHGVFLIGNHADELTPWLPVLATRAGASGYLSIPCMDPDAATAAVSNEVEVEAVFISSLGLGAEGTHKSQYSAYRIWLARLSQWLGWKIECDTLQIPSTRNWAIVTKSFQETRMFL